MEQRLKRLILYSRSSFPKFDASFPSRARLFGNGILSTQIVPSLKITLRTRLCFPDIHDGWIIHWACEGCKLSHRNLFCSQSTVVSKNLASWWNSNNGNQASRVGYQSIFVSIWAGQIWVSKESNSICDDGVSIESSMIIWNTRVEKNKG